ncbi:aldo/keto reductase, partial [Micromonospora sp. CPCC 206060]|uniref:aldo/keto reductase n=1 Tax=Micromonospora sp. CPCC 206060 TaxID=3122406 RepID=UPI002FF0FA34
HDPTRTTQVKPTRRRAPDQSQIRFFGVSINDYQTDSVLDLVGSGDVDAVQLIYNLFHQAPEERLLPACAEHGVGVVVRVPLDEGSLAGRIDSRSTFPEGDWRHNYFGGDRRAQVEQRVNALLSDVGIARENLADLALRYILAAPEVSTIIPGMRTVTNVERNAAVSDGQGHGRRAAGPTGQAPLGAQLLPAGLTRPRVASTAVCGGGPSGSGHRVSDRNSDQTRSGATPGPATVRRGTSGCP